jgi:hypothetical protein
MLGLLPDGRVSREGGWRSERLSFACPNANQSFDTTTRRKALTNRVHEDKEV